MIIYPAIDLKDGKCVRLVQGRMYDATIFADEPATIARGFEDCGASWVHVVDLDGAFAGKAENLNAIKDIRRVVDIKIQTGGGIRCMQDISRMLEDIMVDRVILGSAAVDNPELVEQAVKAYGERIAVGIDAKNGMVAVHGWGSVSNVEASNLALRMKASGVKTIIYTDISKDGMMSGPNFDKAKKLLDETGLNIILSGGVSTIEDVVRAKQLGLPGAIIGKALYTGAVDLKEALAAGGGQCIQQE